MFQGASEAPSRNPVNGGSSQSRRGRTRPGPDRERAARPAMPARGRGWRGSSPVVRGEEPATAVKPGLESGVDPRGGPQPHDVGLVEARVGRALDAREGADRQPPQPGRSLVEDTLAPAGHAADRSALSAACRRASPPRGYVSVRSCASSSAFSRRVLGVFSAYSSGRCRSDRSGREARLEKNRSSMRAPYRRLTSRLKSLRKVDREVVPWP